MKRSNTFEDILVAWDSYVLATERKDFAEFMEFLRRYVDARNKEDEEKHKIIK